jgi:Zn-dependent M28 family amino/carboxypeptidase
LSPEEEKIAAALRTDVERLAGTIGQRNMPHYPQLVAAANFIEAELRTAGFPPKRQTFDVKGRPCANIEAQLAGGKQADEIVVVGAHYDSNVGTPGANDNGSGVAALLTLARRLADAKPSRTVRFVAFVNEEAPYFETELMGSFVYARRCRERQEKITAMLSLETIGYYSDEADSQKYPIPFNVFYPSTGNFIGFIGNVESGDLVKQVVATFRRDAKFPSEGGALPSQIDGVGWSDHWSFWQMGYPAVMVTDTAAFRYPHYHAAEDTPDKLSYDRMARVVVGLEAVVRDLAEWK